MPTPDHELLVGRVHLDVNVLADLNFIPVDFIRRLPAAGVHDRATPGKFLRCCHSDPPKDGSRGGNRTHDLLIQGKHLPTTRTKIYSLGD